MELDTSHRSAKGSGVLQSELLEQDPRWQMTKELVNHPHFRKSPLLSKFLLYIVSRTLEGRRDEITEHAIGVQVFGRSPNYRTVEDNIVRNYARQLRKRLAEHFSEEGHNGLYRIEIPLGGYVPSFVAPNPTNNVQPFNAPTPILSTPSESFRERLTPAADMKDHSTRAPRRLVPALLLTIYSAALIGLTWLAFTHFALPVSASAPASPLWKTIFDTNHYTYIVPPDAGLNLMEDLTRQPLTLTSYIHDEYLQLPLPRFDPHSVADLHTQKFTGFANVQIVAELARRPEYNPARVFLRFPRDLRLDDLKNANAVLLGSSCSNPWAGLVDGAANFAIVCKPGMQGSTVLNRHPLPGELSSYESHWNEPTHETYAVIVFAPNLSGKGHILLLEGLDVAGTQAASEGLLHSDALLSVLKLAARPDGSCAPFEVLLRSTSIESNATDIKVIASRVH